MRRAYSAVFTAMALAGCGAKPTVLVARVESWEAAESVRDWKPWNESVTAFIVGDHATDGAHGLRLAYDIAKYKWPLAMREFTPPLDLRSADLVRVDVFVADGPPRDLALRLGLKLADKVGSPPVPLHAGANALTFNLNEAWLPAAARNSVSQLELILSSEAGSGSGWVVFDNLRLERLAK